MSETLFDKYGGFSTFQNITRLFYRKLLDSSMLRHLFIDVDMERLIDHQARFLSRCLGGPKDKFQLVDLVKAHQHLQINNEMFKEVTELLEESLEDANVEADDIVTVMALVQELKAKIIST